jgi:hypothetical protein
MMLRLAYLAYGLQKKQQDKRQRQTVRQREKKPQEPVVARQP